MKSSLHNKTFKTKLKALLTLNEDIFIGQKIVSKKWWIFITNECFNYKVKKSNYKVKKISYWFWYSLKVWCVAKEMNSSACRLNTPRGMFTKKEKSVVGVTMI